MFHYKLLLSYDGTHYFGWQKTRMGPSIQGCLEKAVGQITQENVLLEAASRTDRGVHAEGQIVSFALQKDFDPVKLQRALNAVLPQDIRVLNTEIVPETFHPTLDAKEKEYHYRICPDPVQLPHMRLYTWHYFHPLNLDAMRHAAQSLLGTHDFTAFTNRLDKNPLCSLSSIEVHPLQITFRGDRFLYKMARNLAGTLLYVGSGKLSLEQIPLILQSRDRKQAGMTAPAHGLFLHHIFY